MKYKRIRFEMMGFEKDFYRDFLIRENVNLLELGIIFIDSIYGEFEHLFCFRDKNRTYVTEQEEMGSPNMLYMSDHHLCDLDNDFTFIYDYGEDWSFRCHISDELYSKPGNDFVYILDGKGLGIFEDNRDLFMEYMNNGLDEEDIEEIWNLPIMDDPNEIDEYDVEREDDRLRKGVPFAIFEYIENLHDAGLEQNMQNIDLSDYKSQEEIDNYFDFEDYDNDLDSDLEMIELAFLESANYLIDNTGFGKEQYNRLINNHEDLEVRAIFMKEILELIKGAMHGENDEFNEKLYKALRKVK